MCFLPQLTDFTFDSRIIPLVVLCYSQPLMTHAIVLMASAVLWSACSVCPSLTMNLTVEPLNEFS
jgi:hypothetical protein